MPLSELALKDMRTQRLGAYRDLLKRAVIRAGGSELCVDGEAVITAEQIRSRSTVLPFSSDVIESYMAESMIDTFTAAEMLGCTRQNIQDLVKRGRLRSFKSLRNNYLFLKSDIAGAAEL